MSDVTLILTKVLLEKAGHDNELIEALTRKQSQLKAAYEGLASERERASRRVEDESREAQIRSMQERNTVEQLRAIVAEREKRVKFLEGELEVARQGAGSEFYLNNNNSRDG
jgi:predicted RNase H-like nuclease (RuvC/YqgF family)